MTTTIMTFDLRNMMDSSFEDLLFGSFNPSFKVKKYTYCSKKNDPTIPYVRLGCVSSDTNNESW